MCPMRPDAYFAFYEGASVAPCEFTLTRASKSSSLWKASMLEGWLGTAFVVAKPWSAKSWPHLRFLGDRD